MIVGRIAIVAVVVLLATCGVRRGIRAGPTNQETANEPIAIVLLVALYTLAVKLPGLGTRVGPSRAATELVSKKTSFNIAGPFSKKHTHF